MFDYQPIQLFLCIHHPRFCIDRRQDIVLRFCFCIVYHILTYRYGKGKHRVETYNYIAESLSNIFLKILQSALGHSGDQQVSSLKRPLLCRSLRLLIEMYI